MSPEERARAHWLAEAKALGIHPGDREEYAEECTHTIAGRSLVLTYAVDDLRDAIMVKVDRVVLGLIDWLERRR